MKWHRQRVREHYFALPRKEMIAYKIIDTAGDMLEMKAAFSAEKDICEEDSESNTMRIDERSVFNSARAIYGARTYV